MLATGATSPLCPLLLLLLACYCCPLQANAGAGYRARHGAEHQIDALDRSVCGLREFQSEKTDGESAWQESGNRVSAGWDAARGEFPWSVILLMDFGTGMKLLCGGSIIHRDLVLTAAHCLVPHEGRQPRVTVWAGLVDYTDRRSAQKAKGTKACFPPGYAGLKEKPTRDLVLVRLDRSFSYNEAVRPICLHSRSASGPSQRTNCIVSGFGLTSNLNGPHERPSFTQKLQGLSQEFCDHSMPGANRTGRYEICMMTGDKNKHPGSTCEGDSGSGLACPEGACDRKGRFFLEGSVSHGPKICGPGHPTVTIYADVFALRHDLYQMIERCR